jgi:predicted DNA-binding transcriptional regulator AlpA
METHISAASEGLVPLPALVDLVAYRDVPALLRMSRTTLDKFASDPTQDFPPRVRLGNRLYVSYAAVNDWVLRQLEPVG